VVFGTDAFRLKDIKGLTFLAQLLGHPGREFHVLDLATVAHGVVPRRAAPNPPGNEDLHPQELAGAGPALDEQAKAAYRQRLLDLEEELDEAVAWSDSPRASKLQEERDFLIEELSAAVGLGGRDRKPGSQSERARVNITRAVRAAVARVREYSPALASHLDATIHTGTFCCYSPDPGASSSWHV
jgi:hypothetical protein